MRTSLTIFLILAWAFSGCGPFLPFDPNPPDNPPPSYDLDSNWLCKPGKADPCDYIPPNSGWIDHQSTAEADCFLLHGSVMLIGLPWNAPPQYNGDLLTVDWATRGLAAAFNGTCRIYSPRYRELNGNATMSKHSEPESFYGAVRLAYSDVERAFDYYLEHYNEGRPFFLVGHSQGAGHLEVLITERIEGTALADRLVAAYLIGGFLRTDSFNITPYCNDPQETGCVVGWNTVAQSFTRNSGFSAVDHFLYWFPGMPHCTNPLSWTNGGGPVPASENPGSVGTFWIEQVFEPGLVGASCRPEDPNDPKAGLLEVEDLNVLQELILTFIPGLKDYHVGEFNLFLMSMRQNAQDRLDSYH